VTVNINVDVDVNVNVNVNENENINVIAIGGYLFSFFPHVFKHLLTNFVGSVGPKQFVRVMKKINEPSVD